MSKRNKARFWLDYDYRPAADPQVPGVRIALWWAQRQALRERVDIHRAANGRFVVAYYDRKDRLVTYGERQPLGRYLRVMETMEPGFSAAVRRSITEHRAHYPKVWRVPARRARREQRR